MYVGKAKNLRKRVSSYFLKNINLGTKTRLLISQIAKIKTIITDSEIEAFLLENQYIKKYKPKYNVKLTDGKAYLMVRITIKDEYPKILMARRQDDNPPVGGSIYFGPFPNAGKALRTVLRTIRKIFPYQSVLNHTKRICLYYHLGLCPCPPVFSAKGGPASGWDSEIEFRKEYRKNIKHIIDFLNGNTKKIIKDLQKERNILSKNEEFEKANFLQNKISQIELITGHSYKRGLDLNINPNLADDLREKEMNDLINILNRNNVHVKKLERIECYDISNISGTNAAGSMVIFINGEKDSSLYRRFKINPAPSLRGVLTHAKKVTTPTHAASRGVLERCWIKTLCSPNDFEMMSEVLQRRMKHPEWPMPNLIIVDGGKGQVSAALKVLKENKLKIPLIGLAKREETIVMSDLKEISLPKNSNALKLIMQIRDEAHRFAITYHRKLRSKSFLSR